MNVKMKVFVSEEETRTNRKLERTAEEKEDFREKGNAETKKCTEKKKAKIGEEEKETERVKMRPY